MRTRLQRIMIVVLTLLMVSSGLLVPDATISAAPLEQSNLTLNPGFEVDNKASVAPISWNVIQSGGTVTTQAEGAEGSYSVRLTSVTRSGTFDNPAVGVYQRFTNLEQGTYTLTARIRSNNPSPSNVSIQEAAFMEAKDTGAPAMRAFVNLFAENTTDWNLITLRNVIVYNGQATVGIYLKDAAAGMTIEVDDVQFYLEHSDQNPVQNWGFETGDAISWQTSGNVSVVTGQADSGAKAVRLEAGAKVAQTVTVKPNTDYFTTVRAKVSDGSNRLRIGVEGIEETRSAPSATTDYSLLPLAFRTGPNETSATIYVEHTAEGGGVGFADSIDLFEMNNDIVKGVDVSFLLVVEDYGGKYKANGVEQDFFDIIRNRGVNAVASMFFVEAGNYVYDENEWKAYRDGLRDELSYQTYDITYVNDLQNVGTVKAPLQMIPGYFGKEQALELGKRAKEHRMKFELSLHYSDTWMSSGKAWKPLSWFGQDLQQLQTTMYNYTYDLIKTLADAGVAPDSVKLGNEQNSGIVWPEGKIWSTGRDGFAKLVNASYQAMKDASPTTRGFIHLNNGYLVDYTNQWFGVNEDLGMKWDGEAYSLYGGRPTGAIVDMLNNNLTKWKGNDVVFSETGLMHTRDNFDPVANGSGMKNDYYEISQRGQYNWLIEYMQAFRDVPNPHGAQLGFFYWAAEWISKGDGHDEWYSPWIPGGSTSEYGNSVDSRTLFTYDGHASDGLYAYLWRGKAISKPLGGEVSHNAVAQSYEVMPTEAQSISVPSGALELREGESEQIVATVQPTNQFVYTNLNWKTSDNSVATVNKKGIVTAISPGTATVTVTLGELTTTRQVVVTAAKLAESIAITSPNVASGSLNAIVGDEIRLKATLSEADNRNVVFTSSDPSVASFLGEAAETGAPGTLIQQTNITSDVTLLVKKDGVSTITVTSADGNASSSFQLTAEKIAVDGIHISEDDFELEMNRTKQLKAVIDPENASFQDVVWESSNELVATVSEQGLVTAVGNGQADITVKATDGGESDSVKVTVINVKTQSIKLDHELIRMRAGENVTVQATVLPADAANPALQWISSNTGVFTVDNGVVTAVADGSAILTVRAVDGAAESSIDVVIADEIPVESVAIDQSAVSLTAGLTAALSAVIQPATADNKQVTWSSSDESVATVDSNGLVIAKSKGETTITVTTADGGLTGTSVVTVNDELQTHYVSASSNRLRAATAAALALDNNASTAWSPGAYRAGRSDIWWVDLGQLAEIESIDMSFWATQRYIVQVSDSNTSDYAQAANFMTVVNNADQLSAGLEVSHSLPEGTKARWIRVEVFESYPNNNWLSIVDFKAHGRFLSQATKVNLNASAATVIMGDSYQLQATVSPSHAPQAVQWTTSDATLATVDANGNVTTKLHNGEQGEIKPVTITAAASNGLSSSAVIGVKSPIIVEAIAIHRKDNQPLPDSGIVVDSGAAIDLDVSIFQGEAAYRSVVWKSAQPEIASVDPSTGLVTAHQAGVAEISVEVDSYSNLPGGFLFVDQVKVAVQDEDLPDNTPPANVAVSPATAALNVGESAQLQATVLPAEASDKSVIWSTSDPSIATVDGNGLVTAIGEGSAVITATTNVGALTSSASIQVREGAEPTVPTAVLTGPQSVVVTENADVKVSLSGITQAYNSASLVIHYDPQKLEFPTATNEENQLTLADGVAESLVPGLQIIGSGVKANEGKILLMLLSPASNSLSANGDVLLLHGKAKADASPGTTNLSVSDFVLANIEGDSVVDTTSAALTVQVKLADKEALNTAIASAQALHDEAIEGSANGQYPAGSKAVLQSAIEAALAVADNEASTQAMVNDAIAALESAVETFVQSVIGMDKTGLNTAITNAQQVLSNASIGSAPGQYPASAKTALENAVSAATAVRDDVQATQDQVDAAIISLNAAVNTFKASVIKAPSANKEALNQQIAAAQSKLDDAIAGSKIGQHPLSAIESLQTAIQTGKSVYEQANSTQSEVDAAVHALANAQAAFASQLITLVPGQTAVTIRDLAILAKYYNTKSTDANWSEVEKADLFGNGQITIVELAAVARMIINNWLAEN
ncbi:uncharacterized protein YjdB/arabinogalactan endo-1,4-beta-galactosidase [Paenibacillus phyllosphaerae]|uniref:Arabinogalactan endo-beta-1,4-galactanase n=1 Tax=Paenibacillus phyllosphaerae TaxID=274593 RepID=A0A7W5AT48_9BACL|nr:Ig-like domain-containing protein [Paenibacillus phyllosphaerae]MBB3108137.1 uncharacterized protein YjdB/arabinogalactan endo-1,4-beta-galactosidase [Paenibacillus phyllosphaerae]